MKCIFAEGFNWPLLLISSDDRVAKEFTTHGNHKSAVKYDKELVKTILSEVNQGWMIPLPLSYINLLKHGELAPEGVDDKVTSEVEDGSRKINLELHTTSLSRLLWDLLLTNA